MLTHSVETSNRLVWYGARVMETTAQNTRYRQAVDATHTIMGTAKNSVLTAPHIQQYSMREQGRGLALAPRQRPKAEPTTAFSRPARPDEQRAAPSAETHFRRRRLLKRFASALIFSTATWRFRQICLAEGVFREASRNYFRGCGRVHCQTWGRLTDASEHQRTPRNAMVGNCRQWRTTTIALAFTINCTH